MSAILPIPTGRTSDYLARSRLVQQIQSDQVDLQRLQTQLSTGRRIFVPSDDPGASVRAITLQRTIERKTQLQINIGSSASKLAAADSALTQVSDILNDARAKTLGVIDTVATDEERHAVLLNIDEALGSLTRFANSQYQDSYLFGGTRALQAPYVKNGNYIEYRGNEASLQAHVEIGQLFDTNIAGDEVFGGLSEPVRGSVDLNLQVSESTYLSQLNGGDGISRNGAVTLSIGLNTQTVDLSGAYTLGDVARLLEQGAQQLSGGQTVTVDVAGDGLVVNPGSSGGVAILEVSGGRTAQELGIRQETASLAPFGGDLNPVLRKTSLLSDLVGVKSSGRVDLGASSNSSIKLRANANGVAFNGLDIEIQNTASIGAESVSYDDMLGVLTVSVNEGTTTAQDVIDLINADASVPYTATVDYHEADSASQAGQGAVVATTYSNVTSGGNGSTLNLSDGLRITNGDGEVVIDTSGAATVEDFLDILNRPEYGLQASINATGDGIDVRSRRAGADFTIAENGGTLAEDLGLRTYTVDSRLDGFNRGSGVIVEGQNDAETQSLNQFTITVRDQGVTTTYQLDPVGLQTVQDVIDRLADPVSQGGTGGAIVGSLATTGNGLVLSRADAVDVAAQSTGTVAYAADTLTFTSDAPGAAGDANFTLEVQDSGSGGLSTTYDPLTGAVVVDLGGSAVETTATIAADISVAVPGYTVTAGAALPAGTAASTPVTVTGGYDADEFTVSGSLAERLGFIAEGQDTVTSTGASIQAEDRNTQEVDSVFNTLLRLREALESNDPIGISDAFELLEEDLNRATYARSELGSRMQNLDVLQIRLEDEEVQLRTTLSEAIDADLAEVISDFTARQFALQASLQTSASLLQMSVLNFI